MKAMRAKITSKGQVTLPRPLRSALSLKSGDSLHFTVEKDGTATMGKFCAPGSSLGCGRAFSDKNVPPANDADIAASVAKAMAEHAK
jgi:AbrB family looped-hinge helix DNA binding protein